MCVFLDSPSGQESPANSPKDYSIHQPTLAQDCRQQPSLAQDCRQQPNDDYYTNIVLGTNVSRSVLVSNVALPVEQQITETDSGMITMNQSPMYSGENISKNITNKKVNHLFFSLPRGFLYGYLEKYLCLKWLIGCNNIRLKKYNNIYMAKKLKKETT